MASDLEIPELRPFSGSPEPSSVPDIRIALGPAPVEVEAPLTTAEGYQIGAEEILLNVPGVGRFWAVRGQDLVIDAAPAANPGAVRLYLLGSALAALIHQRGLIPIHASAIAWKGGCIAFVGDSGAGKSTLASMLARRGHALLSDDVLTLRQGADGKVIAAAAMPLVKLWPASLPHTGFAEGQAPFESTDFNKHRIGAPEAFTAEPMPVERIYALRWLLPRLADPEIAALSAFDAMLALRRNVYRPTLIEALRREGAFLALAQSLLAGAGMFECRRGMDLGAAEAQVDMLVQHFDGI